MRCKCGHDEEDHLADVGCIVCPDEDYLCSCLMFDRDTNWEPPDPPGWEGGFADNH